VLPKGIQTWLMIGIAGVIVLIILFAGQPQPPVRAQQVNAVPQTNSPERVRDYQERLGAINAQLAGGMRPTAPAYAPTDLPQRSQDEVVQQVRAVDPLKAERQRREYESLFASNVAASKRQPMESGASARQRNGMATPEGVSEPSLDEIADAVVRATSRTTPNADASTLMNHENQRPQPASKPAVPDTLAAGPRYQVAEGTMIDAVLTNRLDGGSSAPVNCLVTNAVYSADGRRVLIPAGARILGETRAVEGLGETRLAVSFHRLVMPNGTSASLDHFRALNQFGDSGLHDQVDRHYWSTFGGAAAVGLVGGLSQLLGTVALGSGDGDRTVVVAGGSADAASQAAVQTLSQYLNQMPTITIREGHRVKVYVTRDFDLPEWTGSPSAIGENRR